MASRVRGANKHLKTALLITNATQACLDESFSTRRLCQVRVVNIAEPVTLFELADPNRAGWEVLKKGYEQALGEFTKGEFRLACRVLGRLIPDQPIFTGYSAQSTTSHDLFSSHDLKHESIESII